MEEQYSQGYLFLNTSFMNGETWGQYLKRVQSLIPPWMEIQSGSYVDDPYFFLNKGERFLQGGSVLPHSTDSVGHYFDLKIHGPTVEVECLGCHSNGG